MRSKKSENININDFLMGRFKITLVKALVLFGNVALVVGGIFFIKNQNDKKEELAKKELAERLAEESLAMVAFAENAKIEALEMQLAITQDKLKKLAVLENNPKQIIVQKPVTITRTVTANTETSKKSSTSTSKSAKVAPTPSKAVASSPAPTPTPVTVTKKPAPVPKPASAPSTTTKTS